MEEHNCKEPRSCRSCPFLGWNIHSGAGRWNFLHKQDYILCLHVLKAKPRHPLPSFPIFMTSREEKQTCIAQEHKWILRWAANFCKCFIYVSEGLLSSTVQMLFQNEVLIQIHKTRIFLETWNWGSYQLAEHGSKEADVHSQDTHAKTNHLIIWSHASTDWQTSRRGFFHHLFQKLKGPPRLHTTKEKHTTSGGRTKQSLHAHRH